MWFNSWILKLELTEYDLSFLSTNLDGISEQILWNGITAFISLNVKLSHLYRCRRVPNLSFSYNQEFSVAVNFKITILFKADQTMIVNTLSNRYILSRICVGMTDLVADIFLQPAKLDIF